MNASTVSPPLFRLWEESPDYRRKTCMLLVTHSCNLNCTYCYEKHKDNQMMSFETAMRIIKNEANSVAQSDSFDSLLIDFMGGEPLMNFALIKQVIEEIVKNPLPVPFLCFVTTNATLLDEGKKQWFRKHRDMIWMTCSYDGNHTMQAMNRGTADKEIDLDFFKELWPEQALHMTISQETLPNLASGIKFIQRKGFRLEAALAQGIEWTKNDATLYRQQLALLADFYHANPTIEPVNLFTKNLTAIALYKEKNVQRKFCGTGSHMTTHDVDEKQYGCHMFAPIVLGERAMEVKQSDWSCDSIGEDPRCKSCLLKGLCPTCMGFNYRYRGNVATRDFRWCHMVLAEVMASCEFQIKTFSTVGMKFTKTIAHYSQAALGSYEFLSRLDMNSEAPFSQKVTGEN